MTADYSSMAQQAASSYFGGGGASAAGGGGGGNSSSLKASQDSTYSFSNNADFNVGAKQNNTPLYIFGAVALAALLVSFLRK